MNRCCTFPLLPGKYDQALRDAVAFVLDRFRPIGIIAAGTIVRGVPDPSSDLDLWVIHLEPVRQRLQKFFHSVPAEIFVNPPWVIQKYLRDEHAAARPISVHMMATGAVILAENPIVEELRQQAIALWNKPPAVSAQTLEQARYMAATKLEDAADIADRDPTAAALLLSDAVLRMLQFAFMKDGRFIPRDKDLLHALGHVNPEAAEKALRFCQALECRQRLQLAHELADCILQVRGFFEWSSDPENVPSP